MSSSRKPPSRPIKSPAKESRTAPPNRHQVLLVTISVLVMCGLIGGVFAGLGATDIFGDLFASDSDKVNYIDPNSDIISAQQTVVAQSPDNLESVLLLASLLANSGRMADAIPHYEQALKLAPEDIDARLSFARSLSDAGMQADAELQFRKVLELDADNQAANYYLAELLMASSPQRVDEAVTYYRVAASVDNTTLIGERAQTQVDALGFSLLATPVASPISSATPATPLP